MSRPDTYTQWANERSAPAARIVAFRTWVYAQLGEHLVWPQDTAAREREIGQASHWVERMVADLGDHGYLFQPRVLAELIISKLKTLGHYQRTRTIEDSWAYLRRSWESYVRMEADRLRTRSMELGCHVSQITAALVDAAGGPAATAPRPPTMPELMLQIQQAKAAVRREKAAATKASNVGRPRAQRVKQLELL